MPRGGSRPGAGRKPNLKAAVKPAAAELPKTDAEGYKSDPAWPFGQERPPEPPAAPDLSSLTPLDYLLSVMRDTGVEEKTRIQAAQLAAPYVHVKKGDVGKKEQKQGAAEKAAGKYATAAPPRLAATGGKRV